MIFTNNDLKETGYYKSTSTVFSALAPTTSFFNRFVSKDVVRMINLFNMLVSTLTLPEGQKIEQMLVKELPLQINDEISVFNWLKEHYKPITVLPAGLSSSL